MLRRALFPALVLTLAAVGTSIAAPAAAKWPPWISIESPINPFDQSAHGALFLIHASTRDGIPALASVTATAEGLVAGVRKSIPIRIDSTGRPGVFAVRKQWPAEGAWLVRISLFSTTGIVTLDHADNVASVRVPTTVAGDGSHIPRAVAAREIDTILADAAKR